VSEVPERTRAALDHGREKFSYYDDGSFAGADGPEGVDLFRLHVIRQALAFEVKTGMKMSRVSALRAANEVMGSTYRTKQKALDAINELLQEEQPSNQNGSTS
jgi:hypothetical protein